MRDKDRIDPLLQKLGEIWKENCPDWRFGQLISNLFYGADPFYMEDDEIIKYIENYFKK